MTHAPTTLMVSRRTLLMAGLAGLTVGALSGCATARGRLALALIDVTSSVGSDDWALYRAAYGSYVSSLKPGETEAGGDRLVVAAISGVPLAHFITTFSGGILDDGTPDSDKNMQAARVRMLNVFDQTRTSTAPRQTRLFETLAASQEIIVSDPERDPD
ncbi:MAG: hypothetical protein JWO33_2353, partial [Caulobacteraceae bacterium]|nr:hypothetical protein [Caulobacteraceae bacterium]